MEVGASKPQTYLLRKLRHIGRKNRLGRTTTDVRVTSTEGDEGHGMNEGSDAGNRIRAPLMTGVVVSHTVDVVSPLPSSVRVRNAPDHARRRGGSGWRSALVCALLLWVGCDACNEAVCASIVSKCTLLKSCDCEIQPPSGCSCCKKCFACLEYLQTECCSCVGLCPTPNATATVASRKSIVSDFVEPVPLLWDALTDGDDVQERWRKVTYPVDVIPPPTIFAHDNKVDDVSKKKDGSAAPPVVEVQAPGPYPYVTVNCTVVYLIQCMAEKKCEMSCQSMGASAYRWFQDGCCECVGHRCINYGISESRCPECSYDDVDDVPEEISDEELERLEKEYAEELEALEGAPTVDY